MTAQGFLLFHLNLAFSSIRTESRAEVIRRCYWPLLEFTEETGVPVGVELSGWTLGEIAALDRTWVATFRQLLASGGCELIGSGWTQIIGPLVPRDVNCWNQRLGLAAYEQHLGVRPRIALVNEMAFSTGLVNVYAEAGYDGLVMDRDNVRLALQLEDHPLSDTPTHARGEGDVVLPILWADSVLFQRLQRAVHGDIPLAEYVSFVTDRARQDGAVLPIYCNDAEVFDYRPGRFTAESRQHPEGEWWRVRRVCLALEESIGMQWLTPHAALASELATHATRISRLTSISHPIPVKKQAKYNVNRWAITGRDDLWLNTSCHQIHQAMIARGESSIEQWRDLCGLWASDLRTHITDAKWAIAMAQVATAKERLGIDQPVAANAVQTVKPSPTSKPRARIEHDSEGILWTVTTPDARVVLNVRRGMTIDSLAWRSHAFVPILGTLPQGYFSSIALAADFYSGGLLVEIPGERARMTDLEWVEPVVEWQGDELVLTASLQWREQTLRKTVAIDVAQERLRLCYDFGGWERPVGIVRVGQLTLCADAFIAPLAVSCTNGGRESESFAVDHAVEHGRAASLLVSSTSAFGATDGRLAIHDANGRGFAATWNPARCAAVPMFTHQPCGARALTRLVFSLCEFDDTSRAGGRLLPFDYELRPRGC